jgi:hypothetical protein
MERSGEDVLCSDIAQALVDGNKEDFLAGCGKLYRMEGKGIFEGWITYWEKAFDDLRAGGRHRYSCTLGPYVGDGDLVITRLSGDFRVRIVEDIIEDRLI